MRKKVYLDTNIVYGYFLAKSTELKKGVFKEPKIIRFLKDAGDKFEYYVSIATRAEIMRQLVSELGIKKETGRNLWAAFLTDTGTTGIEVSSPFSEIYEEIIKIVEETAIKRRVTNLEHLIIAKSYELIFVTGDSEVLLKCRKYYPDIVSYVQLRKVA